MNCIGDHDRYIHVYHSTKLEFMMCVLIRLNEKQLDTIHVLGYNKTRV